LLDEEDGAVVAEPLLGAGVLLESAEGAAVVIEPLGA